MLLCYCGTDSTIRNTRDFARSRCAACVIPSSLPFFGWFAIHLQSTGKLTLGRRKGGNSSPLPKHHSDAPQYLSSHSPRTPKLLLYSLALLLPCHFLALYSVSSWCASPLTRIVRAVRSAAKPISQHGHSSLSRIPLMNVSLASFVYHSRGVAESSVAPDNPRTPRIINLASHCLHFYVSIRSTEPFVRRITVSSSRWCLLQLSRASHEVDVLADAASNRTGSGNTLGEQLACLNFSAPRSPATVPGPLLFRTGIARHLTFVVRHYYHRS